MNLFIAQNNTRAKRGEGMCRTVVFFSHAEIHFNFVVIENFFVEIAKNAYDFGLLFFYFN